MPRPFKQKRVFCNPRSDYFKPADIPMRELEQVEITIEELESLRLDSLLQLNQQESADKMGIHQSTFARTAARARQKIADALIHSKSILINRGDNMPGGDRTGPQGKGPKTGLQLGDCEGATPVQRGNGLGRGQGQGLGRGRGRGLGRANVNRRGMGRGRGPL